MSTSTSLSHMKVAIVADWLTVQGGAEKVLQSFTELFPQAEFFTTVYIPESFPFLQKTKVHTTWLQNLPTSLRKRQQILYPFLPSAIETLNLSGFDLVISSSTFVAKGVIVDEGTPHLCYCHTPTRYFWDEWHYFLEEGLNIPSFLRPFKWLFPRMFTKDRIWDFISAQRPDAYIGNSEYIVRRIHKYYRRDATVLRPPVDFDQFSRGLSQPKSDFYIAVGRLIPYKKFDLLIETFSALPNKKLKIVGTGPEEEALRHKAKNCPNIEFLGFVDTIELIHLLGQAKAFLFPQNEDAGIAPMEALCTGTPCIALHKGGSIGMIHEQNGVFFPQQTVSSLTSALENFEAKESYFLSQRENISLSMKQYSSQGFKERFMQILQKFLRTQ